MFSVVIQEELQSYPYLWVKLTSIIFVLIFINDDMVSLERRLQIFDNNLLRFFLEHQKVLCPLRGFLPESFCFTKSSHILLSLNLWLDFNYEGSGAWEFREILLEALLDLEFDSVRDNSEMPLINLDQLLQRLFGFCLRWILFDQLIFRISRLERDTTLGYLVDYLLQKLSCVILGSTADKSMKFKFLIKTLLYNFTWNCTSNDFLFINFLDKIFDRLGDWR